MLASSSSEAEQQHLIPVATASSMSGVEIESPHAALVAEKEQSFEIPGIGTVSTTWIGHNGRASLLENFRKSLETPTIAELKKELRHLSSVCLILLIWMIIPILM